MSHAVTESAGRAGGTGVAGSLTSLAAVLALLTALTALVAGSALPAGAVDLPDLSQGRAAGPLTVYPDSHRPGRFYYPPGELVVATDAEGRPDLDLLAVRYTGQAASGDQGEHLFRSLLSFRVEMDGPHPDQLMAARHALRQQGVRRAELRPLPLRRVEAVLVWTPVDEESGDASGDGSDGEAGRVLSGGRFERAGEGGGPTGGAFEGYWRQRVYTLRLGNADAQLLIGALDEGRVLLSVGWAFLSDGLDPQRALTELTGSPELVEEIRRQLGLDQEGGDRGGEDASGEGANGAGSAGPHLVKAGALSVTVDPTLHPGLVRRVDLNERMPPGYGVLEVYCYDFQVTPAEGEGGPGLFEKRVEIAAESVTGATVRREVSFRFDQPDLYSETVRFPVAVRLDRPYRYRVTSVRLDGSEQAGEWRERESWARLLDVTRRPEGATAENGSDPDSEIDSETDPEPDSGPLRASEAVAGSHGG